MLNDECAYFELISLFRRRVVFDQQRLDFFVIDYQADGGGLYIIVAGWWGHQPGQTVRGRPNSRRHHRSQPE
jgi:hypothetical protein